MAAAVSKSSKALSSLALMETSLLTEDYLSTFLPFIATVSLKRGYRTIELAAIVPDFQAEFGIHIPRAPMQSILSRAVTAGIIHASQRGEYTPIEDKMREISFLGGQQDALASISSVLTRFIDSVYRTHNLILTQDEATDIFFGFLEEYSPTTVAGLPVDTDWYDVQSKRNLYLMGEFIQTIYKTDYPLFEIVRKFAMAYLVATALAFDSAVDARLQEFKDITIYLDTPVVLRLLGLQTEELEHAYRELFASFDATIKPTYKVFHHTFDEISNILSDCASWIDNPNFNALYANDALLRFVEKNYSKTQVEIYRNSLVEKLGEFGITVDNLEYYNLQNHGFQSNEQNLRQRIIEAYTSRNASYDPIRNSRSIDYDISSIDYIAKLWGTKTSRSYSSLGSIFLTSNATLAYVSRKFSSEFWWDQKNHKSPCITDYYLGTMLWLSTPSEKVENFSKLKLLADCSAATTLSREVMDKFLAELKRLSDTKGITDKDYLLIRTRAFEKHYLQNITLNEEDAFKDDTIEQLLEDIKADIRKPLVETIGDREKVISGLMSENADKQERILAMEAERERKDQEARERSTAIEEKGKNRTRLIVSLIAPIIFAGLSFIAVVLQFFVPSSVWAVTIKTVAALLSLVSVVFLALMKTSYYGMYERLEDYVIKRYKIQDFKQGL